MQTTVYASGKSGGHHLGVWWENIYIYSGLGPKTCNDLVAKLIITQQMTFWAQVLLDASPALQMLTRWSIMRSAT